MNWQALDVFVNAIGMIAVVITVIYLAVQTRQNTHAVQGSMRQAMLSEEVDLLFKQIDYPCTTAFEHDIDSMSNEDLVRATIYIIAFLRTREGYWLQYRNGMIDEQTWLTYKTPLIDYMKSRLGRIVWEGYRASRGHFNQEFINEVNQYVDASQITAPRGIRETLGLGERTES